METRELTTGTEHRQPPEAGEASGGISLGGTVALPWLGFRLVASENIEGTWLPTGEGSETRAHGPEEDLGCRLRGRGILGGNSVSSA